MPLPLHDVIDLSNTLAQPSAVLTAQLPTIITTRTIDKEAVSSIFSSTAKASISKYGDIEDKRARKLDSARWIMDYILVEMFGIGEPGSLEPPGQEATTNVHNFLLVPLMLESLIVLGNFVLLDAFLYVLTFLPIRVVFSVLLLCVEVLKFLLGFVFRVFPLRLLLGDKAAVFLGPPWGRLRFHRTNLYDLLRGLLLLLGTAALRQLDMSKVYHFIRGQNVIKLYVLCSMMEIMDKLLRYVPAVRPVIVIVIEDVFVSPLLVLLLVQLLRTGRLRLPVLADEAVSALSAPGRLLPARGRLRGAARLPVLPAGGHPDRGREQRGHGPHHRAGAQQLLGAAQLRVQEVRRSVVLPLVLQP